MTQMPINKKLEKQFIVYSYDRTPHNKRELIHTAWRNLTNTMLKKNQQKREFMIPFIQSSGTNIIYDYKNQNSGYFWAKELNAKGQKGNRNVTHFDSCNGFKYI